MSQERNLKDKLVSSSQDNISGLVKFSPTLIQLQVTAPTCFLSEEIGYNCWCVHSWGPSFYVLLCGKPVSHFGPPWSRKNRKTLSNFKDSSLRPMLVTHSLRPSWIWLWWGPGGPAADWGRKVFVLIPSPTWHEPRAMAWTVGSCWHTWNQVN